MRLVILTSSEFSASDHESPGSYTKTLLHHLQDPLRRMISFVFSATVEPAREIGRAGLLVDLDCGVLSHRHIGVVILCGPYHGRDNIFLFLPGGGGGGGGGGKRTRTQSPLN